MWWMRRVFSAFVLVVVAGVGSACSDGQPSATVDRGVVLFGEQGAKGSLDVALADDPDERARGLMGVTELGRDDGMAFVYDAPSTGSYWMKDTLIPLSIAFVGEDGRIVTVRDMEPCATASCPTYSADAPYELAIEANVGWFGRHDIRAGDPASLEVPSS
jgi:uncharacterized membrane protein (UPF0127 family)